MVLSITIAHTQIDAASRPSMTVLTIQWACRNRVSSERSEEVSGSADCATSAGFMRLQSFRLAGLAMGRHGGTSGCSPKPLNAQKPVRPRRTDYSAKRVQTWARDPVLTA